MYYTQFDICESSARKRCSNTCVGVLQWLNSRIKGFFFFFTADTLQHCHPLQPLIKVHTDFFFFPRQAGDASRCVRTWGFFFFTTFFCHTLTHSWRTKKTFCGATRNPRSTARVSVGWRPNQIWTLSCLLSFFAQKKKPTSNPTK